MWDTSHITFLPSLLTQIQFVTLVFPCHLEKGNPNFKRFLSYELSFKFALVFYALTQQILCSSLPICCIFIPKLLLVGCLTFTMMEYPSQCLLDIWLSWATWSSIWVLNFLRVLCFQTFHLYLCSGIYKRLSFRYQVFGTNPSFLPKFGLKKYFRI